MINLKLTAVRSPALWLATVSVLAAVLAVGPVAAQPMPLAERIKQCAACHGDDGNSKIEKIPSLAGQPEFFILNQLFLMREGVRRIEAMESFVKDLKDEDLQGLSAHFAKLPPKPTEEKVDPDLVKRGAVISDQKRCGSCHLPNLAGQEQMPRLARQRIDYLIESMKSYRDNTRSGADTAMSAALGAASDADIAALAHYASTK